MSNATSNDDTTLGAGITPKQLARYAVIVVSSLAILFPLYWMINLSLKGRVEAQRFPPTFVPLEPTINAYIEPLTSDMWVTWFANTFIVTIGGTLLVLFVATPAAYALARRDFVGKKFFYSIFVGKMMVPPQILFLPLFIFFSDLGLVNTHLGLILVYGGFTAFAIFVLHGFFQTLPDNIEEAARIAGIPEWKIMLRLILPIAKPGVATAGLFVFVFTWNDFLWALVFMQDESLYTVSIGLQQFFGTRGSVVLNQLMAMSTLTSIPVIVLFVFAQNYFFKGVSGFD